MITKLSIISITTVPVPGIRTTPFKPSPAHTRQVAQYVHIIALALIDEPGTCYPSSIGAIRFF